MFGTFGESSFRALWFHPAHQTKLWSSMGGFSLHGALGFLPLDLEGNSQTPQHGDPGLPRCDAPAFLWSGKLNVGTTVEGIPKVWPAQDSAIQTANWKQLFLFWGLWGTCGCGMAGDHCLGTGEQGSLFPEQRTALNFPSSSSGFLGRAVQEFWRCLESKRLWQKEHAGE